MSTKLYVKLSIVVISFLLFTYFVYPSVKFQFLMSKKDREELQLKRRLH